ncbi:MAG: glycosyltransferase family 4 protein [Candidatus Omnitrophica bacterium]|nr:glycosyltransferase family 4 protein [Candidatus Omnitrophota bacterium]
MNTPLNILYIHEMSGLGGAENSLLNLVEHMDKDKFKVFFVLPENGIFADKLRKLGIDVQFVKMPRFRFLIGADKAIRRLIGISREKDINLIHSQSIRTNMYGAIVAKLQKIPVIWHARSLVEKEMLDLDRLFSFLPDRIICNSKAVARRFEKNNRLIPKARIIYNGVDLGKFNSGIDSRRVKEEFGLRGDTAVIGIASRFSKNKGHEYFFEEARTLKKIFKGRDIKFLVIGGAVFKEDAYREQYLRKVANKLGLKDSVIFCGFREDMPELFNALDIFVLTSRAEACGRVLLEAMASGRPVVATNSGGTPELVPDGKAGVLIAPSKPHALSAAIIELLKDAGKRQEMGVAARNWVEQNFSIERNVKETERAYFELFHGC